LVLVSVEPSGRFTYVANSGSSNVSLHRISAASGELTAFGTVSHSFAASIATTGAIE